MENQLELIENYYQVYNNWEGYKVLRFKGTLEQCEKFIKKGNEILYHVDLHLEEYSYNDWKNPEENKCFVSPYSFGNKIKVENL